MTLAHNGNLESGLRGAYPNTVHGTIRRNAPSVPPRCAAPPVLGVPLAWHDGTPVKQETTTQEFI